MEADMIASAFFFSLSRPGEYTATKSESSITLRAQSLQLWQGCIRLDLETATEAELLAATFASLTLDKQKNSVRANITSPHSLFLLSTFCV
jgi:hypothetical protein